MSVAVVTGSGGLVGAETTKLFLRNGLDVVGIDNDMRAIFFGTDASTRWQIDLLEQQRGYAHNYCDIRDQSAIDGIFSKYAGDIAVIVHCAAQPSHDWAVRDPHLDFTVNANGTLTLLEIARKRCPDAPFIFVSTNKVYGDRPNHLPLDERETRFELSSEHTWAERGVPEEMPIDNCLHSLFGASKLAADVLVQEYGRYFGMKPACFRGGCLTGPGHSGAQLHGFLAFLVRCAVTHHPYSILGYKGKQVRDNLHARDLASAFWAFFKRPMSGEVFNIGGGRHCNCSMIEAIKMTEELTGRPMDYNYASDNRIGDHIWWISDVSKFRALYPEWQYSYDIKSLMADIHYGVSSRVRRDAA